MFWFSCSYSPGPGGPTQPMSGEKRVSTQSTPVPRHCVGLSKYSPGISSAEVTHAQAHTHAPPPGKSWNLPKPAASPCVEEKSVYPARKRACGCAVLFRSQNSRALQSYRKLLGRFLYPHPLPTSPHLCPDPTSALMIDRGRRKEE